MSQSAIWRDSIMKWLMHRDRSSRYLSSQIIISYIVILLIVDAVPKTQCTTAPPPTFSPPANSLSSSHSPKNGNNRLSLHHTKSGLSINIDDVVPVSSKSSQEMVSVSLPGDIVLGGLFPVHEKGEGTPCGPKVYNRGVHRLEAMLYAVDRVNNDTTLLPGIVLGVHILDTCSRDTYALNQSLQFVRASLNNLDTSAFECPDDIAPRLRKNASSGPVFGVIGGSYSSVSLQVANLLRLFHIPQISPASTAKTLSDKTRFDLFARTVPPDTFQSVALVDIIKCFNWSYVSTIHSEGSYGEYGIEAFHKEASERNVCIAAAEKVPSVADDKVFDAIISKLLKKPSARGVVLFARAEDARSILLAAKRANLEQPFHWIASDGWGKQQKLLEGLEDIAEGAITVELQSEIIEDFDRYMMELTPPSNTRNPWFDEFWEDTFNCVLMKNYIKLQRNENAAANIENEKVMPNDKDAGRSRICDKSLRLSEKVGYEQESKSQFVIDAVYAFAHALHKLHNDLCFTATRQNDQGNILEQKHHHSQSGWYRKPVGSHSPACPDMANYDGKDFYNNYLLNVSFIDLAGSEVKFDRQGDGLARYDILNYQRLENSSGYHYKVVGKWFNQLEINIPEVVWNKENELPISACSLPCQVGMIKKQQGDTCCWICDNCEPYEYVFDEFTCKDCGPGYWPYPDKLSCFALNIQYIRWKSLFALIPMTIAIIGIIMTVLVIALFARNNDTPLVRASGRELSYTLLFGILVCYCNTFALIAKPTIVSCILQRFGIGVGFSIIYSALLTKTNRIARIFQSASKSAQRLSYISPQSQVIITASLIAIQVLINMVWMIVEPPGTRFFYPDRTEVILKCKIQDMSFLFSQLYNMILITICTIYAIKTREIPENFNESKFIGFTMYTTCIIWLAFVPIYFGTGNSYEIQITTLCISISLSASVALICLYSPKVYILVFHPDKNIRKLTMNHTVYKRAPYPDNGDHLNSCGGCKHTHVDCPDGSTICTHTHICCGGDCVTITGVAGAKTIKEATIALKGKGGKRCKIPKQKQVKVATVSTQSPPATTNSTNLSSVRKITVGTSPIAPLPSSPHALSYPSSSAPPPPSPSHQPLPSSLSTFSTAISEIIVINNKSSNDLHGDQVLHMTETVRHRFNATNTNSNGCECATPTASTIDTPTTSTTVSTATTMNHKLERKD